MPKETDPVFHCNKCNQDFKRHQDLKMHQTKVHSRAKATPKEPKVAEPRSINHIDIIAMLNVKINALIEVKKMFERL